MRRTAGKIRIEGFGKTTLARGEQEPSPESVQKAVHTLLHSSRQLKKAKVVIGLGSNHVVFKRDSYPALSKKELVQTILFDIQREMGFKEGEEEGVVCDFRPIGPDPKTVGNTEYFSLGVPQSLVEQKLAPFLNENAIPAKVLPDLAVYANFLPYLAPVPEGDAVGFLDIGAQKSLLVIYRRGCADFFREIVVGGDDFTKAITGTIFHEGRAIQFSSEEAQDFKNKYGYPLGFSEGMTFRGAPLTEVGTMMRPVMERLTGEIHRSIGFYRDKSGRQNVSELVLLGGGSTLKHLPEVLTEKIEIPVSHIPFPKNLRIAGGKEQGRAFRGRFAELAGCFALALESYSEFNLLPAPYKKIHILSEIRKYVYLFAGVLAAVACVAQFIASSKLSGLKQEKTVLEKSAALAMNNARRFEAISRRKMTLDSLIGIIDKKMLQDQKPIQVMRCISHSLPKSLSLNSYFYGGDLGQLKEEITKKLNLDKKQAPPPGPKTNPQSVNPSESIKENPLFVYLSGESKASIPDIRISVAELIMNLENSGLFQNVQLAEEKVIKETNQYLFDIVGILK